MSTFLHIECDPLDQPAATDPLEKATWSSVRIRVGASTVSRVLDRKLDDERSLLYIPLFAIAEWMVTNWWALLNEPCRGEFLPPPDADEPAFSWTRRHCLRAAESDLLLPALYFWNDGRDLRVEWRADSEDALPHMPAFFVDSGRNALHGGQTEQTLSRFVSDVLTRVNRIDDSRVRDLRETWDAIRQADAEERDFCVMAGRLGLDPYDRDQTTDAVAAVIEQLAEADDPLVQDITTVASPENLAEQWRWVEQARQTHHLGASPQVTLLPPGYDSARADKYGYQVARDFRRRASLSEDHPLASIEELAGRVLGFPLRTVDENHLVGRGVKFIAGKADDGTAQLIGPRAAYLEDDRFRIARGLFQVAVASARGPRLVTDAFTWNQRASRAFAAELIAPQEALKKRVGGWAAREDVPRLASEFQASTMLIERQLTNAHVPVAED